MSEFIVTEKAERPANKGKKYCFYCRQKIGEKHTDECVLIKRKVKIKMEVEYEIVVPADWSKDEIEFNRNSGSWCADNVLEELKELSEENYCLCDFCLFKVVEDKGEVFLDED